ncbi:MAG TPA: DUF2303 family protein [Thermomonas sp.]|nr:DUF2303 family protein [Thermomonas sp.]
MEDQVENVAATLAKELPKPQVLFAAPEANGGTVPGLIHLALPKGWTTAQLDNEKMLPSPRRVTAAAAMTDAASFIAYVLRNRNAGSMVWCDFNPTSYALQFTAVFDEHHAKPGWRSHKATFKPAVSAEWGTWIRSDKQSKSQVAFAEFLEQNEQDISALDGFPTSLDMVKMATEFEARQDQRLKSTVRLQSGGIRLEYVADADSGTTEAMKIFDKFVIGIPVFWTQPKAGEPVAAYHVKARLRYRQASGAVNFYYELIRPDLVHQRAALELIEQIRAGIGETPLLMGGIN